MNYLSIVIFLSVLLSCNTSKKSSENTKSEEVQVPTKQSDSNVLISLEKGACFGRCPIYKMHINQDGSMEIEGKRFVDFIGPHTANLSPEALQNLNAQIKEMAWSTYPEKHPTQISDLPSSKISYWESGNKTTTEWSHGAPEELDNLALSLHDIAMNTSWKRDESRKMEPHFIPTEIIVKLKDEKDFESFLNEFKNYGVSLKEKLIPSMPMYTIYYDSGLAYPYEMLDLIKESKFVEMAEFNKKVDKRD